MQSSWTRAAIRGGDLGRLFPTENIWPNGAGPLQTFTLGPIASWSRLVWHLRQLGENG